MEDNENCLDCGFHSTECVCDYCEECGEQLEDCECEEEELPLSFCDLKDREIDMRYEEQEEK